ncbi:MAG TPA: rubredoxin [Methanobacterium sp.]|nr:rubredoxin [Methanobacterium sp.]
MRTIPPPFLVPVSPYTIQIHGENNQMRLLPLSSSLLLSKKVIKMVYKCDICNYIYDPNNGDPEHGIKAGNDLKDLPSTWVYLVCGIEK